MQKQAKLYVLQFLLLFGAVVLSRRTPAALYWGVASCVGLALFWEAIDRRGSENQSISKPQQLPAYKFAGIIAVGMLSAYFTGSLDFSMTDRAGGPFSLIGLPYFLPLGAFFVGAFATSAYMFVYWLLKQPVASIDFYWALVVSYLTMIVSYWRLFQSGHFASVMEFFTVYLSQGVVWLPTYRGPFAGIGPAPEPIATVLLQIIGFGVGGFVVFTRAKPVSTPWSSKEEV